LLTRSDSRAGTHPRGDRPGEDSLAPRDGARIWDCPVSIRSIATWPPRGPGCETGRIAGVSTRCDPWRSNGDTVERLELLAIRLVSGRSAGAASLAATRGAGLRSSDRIRPAIEACGKRGNRRADDGT
jgi:hypothetical protein